MLLGGHRQPLSANDALLHGRSLNFRAFFQVQGRALGMLGGPAGA